MHRTLNDDQLISWSERGFFRIDGFADADTCDAMLARVSMASHVSASAKPSMRKNPRSDHEIS